MTCCNQNPRSYTIRRYDPGGETMWIRDFFAGTNWGSLPSGSYADWALSVCSSNAWIGVGGPLVGNQQGRVQAGQFNVVAFDPMTGSRLKRWNVWDDSEKLGETLIDSMQLNVVDVCAGQDGSLGVLTAAADWEQNAEWSPTTMGSFGPGAVQIGNLLFGWSGGASNPNELIGLMLVPFEMPQQGPVANVFLWLNVGQSGVSLTGSPPQTLWTIQAAKGPGVWPASVAQAQGNTLTSASVVISQGEASFQSFQVDVTAIVQEVTSSGDWIEGDPILFYFTPPSGRIYTPVYNWEIVLGAGLFGGSNNLLLFCSEQVLIVYDSTLAPKSATSVNPPPGTQFSQIEIDSSGLVHLAGQQGTVPDVTRVCIALDGPRVEVIGAEYPASGNTLKALRNGTWASYLNDQAPGNQNLELPSGIAVQDGGGLLVAGQGFRLDNVQGIWCTVSSSGALDFVGNVLTCAQTTRVDTSSDRYYLAGVLDPTVFCVTSDNVPDWGHKHQSVDDLAAVADTGVVTVGGRSTQNSNSETSFVIGTP